MGIGDEAVARGGGGGGSGGGGGYSRSGAASSGSFSSGAGRSGSMSGGSSAASASSASSRSQTAQTASTNKAATQQGRQSTSTTNQAQRQLARPRTRRNGSNIRMKMSSPASRALPAGRKAGSKRRSPIRAMDQVTVHLLAPTHHRRRLEPRGRITMTIIIGTMVKSPPWRLVRLRLVLL